jgi:hypothetical protein
MATKKSGSWDIAPVPCNQCGRHYRADLIKQCPGCAASNQSKTAANKIDSTQPATFYDSPVESSRGNTTLDDLVRAQNRTTHAVRAFVRFLFIQLTGITLAVFLWNISLGFVDEQACYQYGDNCTGNAFLQFLAGIVWIVAVIWSSSAGWDELNKSNVD